jgi:hypothetical protein
MGICLNHIRSKFKEHSKNNEQTLGPRHKKILCLRQNHSHYGNILLSPILVKLLEINTSIFSFCCGILYALMPVPGIKRKTGMKSFEDKLNFNLLHTYLYVSYLDVLSEHNSIELKNQKNAYLIALCLKPDFNTNLCLNLIMGSENLITPKN